MGVQFAIVDEKNKRVLEVGKLYGLTSLFSERERFTKDEYEVITHSYDEPDGSEENGCGYIIREHITKERFDLMVDFCDAAEWNVRVILDDDADEWNRLQDGGEYNWYDSYSKGLSFS